MRTLATILFVLGISSALRAAELAKLQLLYLGDPGTPRAEEFLAFLKTNVAIIELRSRDNFKATDADPFHVVLLDWPQSNSAREHREKGVSPLGRREEWTKPTLLLGSAGLNIAVVWKVRGGSG